MSKRIMFSIVLFSWLFVSARAEDRPANQAKNPGVTQHDDNMGRETAPGSILTGGEGSGAVTDEQCQRAFLGDWTGIDGRISGGLKLTIDYSDKKEQSLSKTKWATLKNCIKKIAQEADICGCAPKLKVVEPDSGKISGRDRDMPKFSPPIFPPVTELPDLFENRK